MRIAIASQNYLEPNNGQAVFTLRLAEGLAARGHEVHVLLPSERGGPYTQTHDGVRLHALRTLSLAPFYPHVQVTLYPDRKVLEVLREIQPEIVHIQDPFPLCRAAVGPALRLDLPLVGTNHFLPENILPFVPVLCRSRTGREWTRSVLWRVLLSVFDHLDLAASPTETAARILREQGLRVPVQPISNGVDIQRFHPDPSVDRTEVRRRFGLRENDPVFLYLGRLDREKRLDVLLEAMTLVRGGRNTRIQLAIAGRGQDAAALQARAKQLDLGDRVVFPGYVPAEDVVPLLNSVDLFAMPSEAELQSIATLEAMATGRPVLAADARALPELVDVGRSGYLFRPGDPADAAAKMDRLVEERARWPAMGGRGREVALTHAIPNTLRRYEEWYAEALRSRAAADADLSVGTLAAGAAQN